MMRLGPKTTNGSETRGGSDEVLDPASPGRPDHLAVWLNGFLGDRTDPVIDDGRLGPDFQLERWVREVREAYPTSVLAATFGRFLPTDGESGDGPGSDWLGLTRCAAGVNAGSDQRSFTGDTTPTSLRSLRRWATSHIDPGRVAVDDVALVVSELSTNVERHGGNWLTLDLVDRGDAVVVAVTDPAGERLPAPRNAGPDEVSGRGLLVVGALSIRWGLVLRSTQKTVWAAFSVA